jgi:uncharacterized DUF497 family protein
VYTIAYKYVRGLNGTNPRTGPTIANMRSGLKKRRPFGDSRSIEFFDPKHSEEEDRFLRIGYSTGERLLLIVFGERESGGVIRLISARKATAKEAKAYEERI